MSRQRVSLLTIRSLTVISQVCSSPGSCDSIKALNLLKHLSTAAERLDFQNPNGYNMDHSLQFDQNPTGFYTEQSSIDFQQKSNCLNTNRVSRESPENYRESDGRYCESFRGEKQNSIGGQNGNFKVFYGQTDGSLKQKSSGIYGETTRGYEQNSNHFDQKHRGVYQESTGNEYQNNAFQQNGNFSGYIWNNNGQLQQNLIGKQAQMSWSGQHNPNDFYGGNANMQNQYDDNSQRFSEYLGSFNGNCMQNTGQYQQIANSHYTGNFGNCQNGPSVHQQNQNAGHYQWDQSHGQYRPNPNVAQCQSNSNNVHNRVVASQVLTSSKPEGELAESSGSSQITGTFQELDAFLTERKVKEAVEVLGLLEKQSISVDLPRFLQLMQACGEAKALEEAKAVHEHVERLLSPLKVNIYNRILKMYSECGSMDDAFNVFNNMRDRNLTSWDTMITGLAKNGLGEDAIDLFTQFKQGGWKPDGQMFIGVFSACSVLGDVDEGMLHFESMSKDYGIVPSMKHYLSIVDMLGSTGYLDEALDFIGKMPMEPSVDVWETLMNLCRIHGNLELGDHCAEIVEQLDPSHLNEKSKAGLVPVKVSDLAKEKEKKKLASQNLLEVRSRVHEYRAGDTSHPDSDKIYAQIRCLKAHMKEAGYIPETRFVLHDIDQEGKEEALLVHSERLAVSQGLLSSPARSPIRIIKNLRVCGDCHSALKIISKIVGREFIIRDAKRFHHFKDGLCSCRDYW
ncbi:Pentatricopeptide repeat-containing protein [Melia azedarach]|uniref:Pentatricopeptide repeat-containing protein n=1 Tax=Melia azedarach TaxID=155640 RepID=A0ACC1X9A3_MELAZ|nr:Pentatricopeptide repeat-containing protein [Melia azedarach]